MPPTFFKFLRSSTRTLSLLNQCNLTMKQIKQIQAHLIISGEVSNPYAAGKIIAFCAISEHGDLEFAHNVFRFVFQPTTFIWNTLIRAYQEKNEPIQALNLYRKMLQSGYSPNNYTFSFLLKACLELSSVIDGMKFHAQIVRFGWESYDFVQNGLIHMYANCGCITFARRVFDMSCNKDVVSWTAMVNGYAKSGQIEEARNIFDKMPDRNAISWSTMINCYSQVGLFKEALRLFNDMQNSGICPNHAGIVGALSACAFLGALEQGRWIHAYINKNKIELDRILGTALIDMYSKCGLVDIALQVFDDMTERDVFAWTSIISGLSDHGRSKCAMEMFINMQKSGVEPNGVTFVCVLSACSRMGLVDEGLRLFESMSQKHGLKPGVEHYGCLVDLLGRSGLLEEAKKVVQEMPIEPDAYVLGALLNACRVQGEMYLGEETVKMLSQQRLDHGGIHVLLSNIYASANRWEDVAKVRRIMEGKNVRKVPGCSLVEVDGVVYEFIAGDRSHPLMEVMVVLLNEIGKQMKTLGASDAAIEPNWML